MAVILPLTLEALLAIDVESNAPGQLARSWMKLTRLVRDRLRPGAVRDHGPELVRHYRDATHCFTIALTRSGRLTLSFGMVKPTGESIVIGQLAAHWDEVGLTGPYRVLVRERTYTINTFCAVLEPYLALPLSSHSAR